MQPRQAPPKPKYRLKDYAATGAHTTTKSAYTSKSGSCKLYCLCNEFDQERTKKCSRCNESYHSCVANKSSGTEGWECCHCRSQYMDPIYNVDSILLETFFKTDNIYQHANYVEFVFMLSEEQVKNPVEIRSMQDGRIGLVWPMQGGFFLNKDITDEPVFDIKPLLKNSNRKYRKEEAFILPQEKLKVGKNVLVFYIPKLNQTLFESKYQAEVRSVYFIAIYSIKKLSKEELIKKTFLSSKIDKSASMELFKKISNADDPDLTSDKTKLCLECPYMKSRIKIPIRGRKCMHYMVICLDTLIQTRSSMNSREWLCPICTSEINEPIIDMFIFSMLNDGSAGIEVVVNINGEYEWVGFEDDADSLSSDSMSEKGKKIEKIEAAKKEDKTDAKSVLGSLGKQVKKSPDEQSKQVTDKTDKKESSQKIIQTIDLDDDDDLPMQQKVLPKIPLEIVIPEETMRFNKEKEIQAQKDKLKQSLKEKEKDKKKKSEGNFVRENPKKDQFLITDVRELDFKLMSNSDFVKKYFNFEYNRSKVNEELRIIFKDVL